MSKLEWNAVSILHCYMKSLYTMAFSHALSGKGSQKSRRAVRGARTDALGTRLPEQPEKKRGKKLQITVSVNFAMGRGCHSGGGWGYLKAKDFILLDAFT